jgi:hemerythrin superfamily protein
VTQRPVKGDMSDLAAVVASDHAAIRQIFDEVRRDPDTPGVTRDLTRHLLTEIAAHGRVEDAVVHPALRDALGAGVADEAKRDHDGFETLMDALMPPRDELDRPALARLETAVTAHMEREEREILPRLENALGAKGTATLAQAYAQATEARMGLVVEYHRRS